MRTRASNCFDHNLDPEDSQESATIRDAFIGEIPTDLSELPDELITGGLLGGIPEYVAEYNRRFLSDVDLEQMLNTPPAGQQ